MDLVNEHTHQVFQCKLQSHYIMGKQVSITQGLLPVASLPNLLLYEEPLTGLRLQLRRLSFPDPLSLQNQLTEYHNRITDPHCTQRVRNCSSSQGSFLCQDSLFIDLLIQHVQYTLQQIHTLSQYKALFILHRALKGFYALSSRRNQLFQVNSKMIGFTSHDQVKVWLNQDGALNDPTQPRKWQQSNSVESILTAVQKALLTKRFSYRFWAHINSKSAILSFQRMIEAVEEYAQEAIDQTQKQSQAFSSATRSSLNWKL